MAVGQNLLFGRMKNKIGGIVTSTWKGINVIKSKPLTVANPRTDAQTAQRAAMILVMSIARAISSAINFGFKEQAVYKSAFNAFVGYTLRNAVDTSAPPAATLVAADVLVAQGTISSTAIDTAAGSAGTDDMTVTYSNAANSPGQSNSDKALTVAYNVTQDLWMVGTSDGNERLDGTTDVSFPDGFLVAGNTVRVYLFFYNLTSRKASDSTTTTFVVGA